MTNSQFLLSACRGPSKPPVVTASGGHRPGQRPTSFADVLNRAAADSDAIHGRTFRDVVLLRQCRRARALFAVGATTKLRAHRASDRADHHAVEYLRGLDRVATVSTRD